MLYEVDELVYKTRNFVRKIKNKDYRNFGKWKVVLSFLFFHFLVNIST